MAEVFLSEAQSLHFDEKRNGKMRNYSVSLDESVLEWIQGTPLNTVQKQVLKEKFIEHLILDSQSLKALEASHLIQLNLPVGTYATFEKHFSKWKKEVLAKESKKDLTPTNENSTNNGPKYFEACEQTIESMCGETEKVILVKIVSKELKDSLKSYIQSSIWYEEEPQIRAMELLQYLPNFKSSNVPCLLSVSNFLEKQFEELTSKVNKMVQEGVIEYSSLWYSFQKGTKIYTWNESELIGTTISSCKYIRSCWSPCFKIEGEVIKTDGMKFFMTRERWSIPAFGGTMKLSELPVRLMTTEILERLTERGKLFRKIAIGHHYMSYNGSLNWRTWCGMNQFKASGRVMIDGVSFSRMNPNYNTFNSSNRCNDTDMETLPDENLFMSFPTVPGFSFSAKKWGELCVEKLTNINFDSTAYERLVLPIEKKSLIKALVLNNTENQQGRGGGFSDLITGKGAGCIFLLHGPPGVGKTLTAEAIADLLEKPLYSVSVGELGTNTTELENKLREILEVAGTWKAVILIDEADIFLEKRNESDIVRNAMVGIFLRLLEYHQGVLFLTTNRVKSFDSAFHSRISIALKYDDLDQQARAQIWETFLSVASIPFITQQQQQQQQQQKQQQQQSETQQTKQLGNNNPSQQTLLDPQELAKYELNGRQIRTTVRLAQALAEQEKVPVGPQHIEVTVKIANQFQHDLLSDRD